MSRYPNLDLGEQLIVYLHFNRNVMGGDVLGFYIIYVDDVKVEAPITHFFDRELQFNCKPIKL